MKENRGAVLRAEVWSLAVHLRWVVSLPEGFQQLFISDFRRIKTYLHDFRMPRFIRANIFVSGIRHLSAAVAYCGVDHSRHALKRCFNTPETSCSKSRNLCHGITSSCKFLSHSTCRCWMRELPPAIHWRL